MEGSLRTLSNTDLSRVTKASEALPRINYSSYKKSCPILGLTAFYMSVPETSISCQVSLTLVSVPLGIKSCQGILERAVPSLSARAGLDQQGLHDLVAQYKAVFIASVSLCFPLSVK